MWQVQVARSAEDGKGKVDVVGMSGKAAVILGILPEAIVTDRSWLRHRLTLANRSRK